MTRQAVNFRAQFVAVERNDTDGAPFVAILAGVELDDGTRADVWRIPATRIGRFTGLRGCAVEGVAVIDDATGERLAVRNVRRLTE